MAAMITSFVTLCVGIVLYLSILILPFKDNSTLLVPT
jgi:hypothetical protein